MIFQDFFTDNEISVYSALAEAISLVASEEDFKEYLEILEELDRESLKRLLALGVVMGAYYVQEKEAETHKAKSN